MIVGTADARPQEVFRVANPSIWPLVAGCGLVFIFAAELISPLRDRGLLQAAYCIRHRHRLLTFAFRLVRDLLFKTGNKSGEALSLGWLDRKTKRQHRFQRDGGNIEGA